MKLLVSILMQFLNNLIRLHPGWWQDERADDATSNPERVQQRRHQQSSSHGWRGIRIIDLEMLFIALDLHRLFQHTCAVNILEVQKTTSVCIWKKNDSKAITVAIWHHYDVTFVPKNVSPAGILKWSINHLIINYLLLKRVSQDNVTWHVQVIK